MGAARTVLPEALDHLPADDPQAIHSRRDLQRIHRWMGTRSTLLQAWHRLMPAAAPAGRLQSGPARPDPLRLRLRVLELGAGDGSLMLGLAGQLAPAWGQVDLTLLDRQALVSSATLAAYARLGWRATAWTHDALDWADGPASSTVAAAPGWDLIVANLFLHHFEAAALRALLGAVATQAQRFIAIEPRRAGLAMWASRAVGLIGANAVTREDAKLSVRAGFCGRELSAAWPATAPAWQLDEGRAGLFSHRLVGRAARGSAGLPGVPGAPGALANGGAG